MTATIEIPDDLYRKVEEKSAAQGLGLSDVTVDLYKNWLADFGSKHQDPAEQERLLKLVLEDVGCFDSGFDDLGSNPKHMEGFGEYSSRRS